MGRSATGKGRARTPMPRVTKTCRFPSYLIRDSSLARVSAKEQQELAMCWCWDRVSGSVIVSDTRTEGSKGLGVGSVLLKSDSDQCYPVITKKVTGRDASSVLPGTFLSIKPSKPALPSSPVCRLGWDAVN